MWPALQAPEVLLVKLFDRHSKLCRVAAYLVQRHQSIENVKSGVFNSFGHDGPGDLLNFHDKIDQRGMILFMEVLDVVEQQSLLDEVKDRLRRSGVPPSSLRGGPSDTGPFLFRWNPLL